MRKIEAGMLVRITPYVRPVIGPESAEAARKFDGHIGRVLRLHDYSTSFGDRWDVEGAEPGETVWPSWALEPIDPPKTTTWEHVAEDTGWSPTKRPTAA